MLDDLIDAARSAAPTAFREDVEWPSGPWEVTDGWAPDLPVGTIRRLGDGFAGRVTFDDQREPSVDIGEPGTEPDDYLGSLLKGRGVDALAWYRSYHKGEDRWGIYIRESGVRLLGRSLGGELGAAYDQLWLHEFAHFLADVVATQLEVSGRVPTYLPHLTRTDQGHVAWCRTAEGLANAYAFTLAPTSIRKPLRVFMRSQPVGYRDGPKIANAGLATARQQLVAHLSGSQLDSSSVLLAGGSHLLFDLAHWLTDEELVPVYWVPDARPVLHPVAYFLTVASFEDSEPAFQRDLQRLKLGASWEKTKRMVMIDAHHPGSRLKKLKGSDLWSVRLDRSHRATLRLEKDGVLVAHAVDKRSEIYR